MSKTQPLLRTPVAKVPSPPVTVAKLAPGPVAGSAFDAIPMPLCWGIFGISAVTLLIQIWNYLGF